MYLHVLKKEYWSSQLYFPLGCRETGKKVHSNVTGSIKIHVGYNGVQRKSGHFNVDRAH